MRFLVLQDEATEAEGGRPVEDRCHECAAVRLCRVRHRFVPVVGGAAVAGEQQNASAAAARQLLPARDPTNIGIEKAERP